MNQTVQNGVGQGATGGDGGRLTPGPWANQNASGTESARVLARNPSLVGLLFLWDTSAVTQPHAPDQVASPLRDLQGHGGLARGTGANRNWL